MPSLVSVPAAGSVVIFTVSRLLAGVSFGSLKPKSAVRERVVGVFDRRDRRCCAPVGASLTGVTLTRDRVGRRIEIDAAVGRAAVVLHLEGEAGVAARRWRWPGPR